MLRRQKYSVGCIYIVRGITPKLGISIIVGCQKSAIAQNRDFLAAAPVLLRDEKKPMLVRSKRCDRTKQVFTRSRACPV